MSYLPCRACAKKQPPETHSYYECPLAKCDNCGGRGHFLSRCPEPRQALMTFTEDEMPNLSGCSTLALTQECAKYGLKDGEDYEMAQRLGRLWEAKKQEEKKEEKKKVKKKEEKKKEKKEEKKKEEETLLPEYE